MTGSPRAEDALLVEQAQVLELIVRGRPLVEVLGALCLVVERGATTPAKAAILLVENGALRSGAGPSLPDRYHAAIDGVAIAPDVGTCAAAAARREVVVTPDLARDPGWQGLAHLAHAEGLVAAWSMPILAASGAVLGTFGTYFTEAREPAPHERRLVEVMARIAALAIERDRADRMLRDVASRQRFLAELDAATQALSEPAEVTATAARLLAEHLGADRCAYAAVDDERVFDITGDYTRGVPSIVGRWEVAAFGPACVAAMRDGAAFVVEDAEADPRIPDPTAYRATAIRAVVCVPLHKAGVFTAAMAVHQRGARRWTAEEIELVGVVAARCWEALERVRVTRDLRASEARYRAIVEATPECVALIGCDGALLQVNAAGRRVLELAPGELTRDFLELVAADDRAAFRAHHAAVCRGESDTLAFEIVGARGARRAIESAGVPLPSPDGYIHLAVARDVTARVAAERALAESRARLDYAVRLSGVGFWYCDLPFDELIWDDRVKQHFWLAPDARVTIELFYERIHPDDRGPTRAAIDASIADHTSYDVVYRTVDPASGAVKFIRALGGTAYAADATPLRFDGVTIDVTAQKHAEERLAGVARAALTIHSASSLASVMRVVTEEARALIGARRAVTVALGETGPISAVASDRPAGAAFDAGTVDAVLERLPGPARHAVAPWPDLLGEAPRRGVLAVPFVGRDGARFGFVEIADKREGELSAADESIAIQLAQLAVVAIENARLYDQLREQDRRKDEFLATLAHELRNPLAPIRTGLHVLDHEVTAEQAARTREMMGRQLGHLVRMVDDLLEISRVTLGKITLQRSRVDLRDVLDSALETTRSLIDARGHALEIRLADGPLAIDVDPTRLSQVFANLLNNAAKYTPDGGTLAITAEVSGPALVVRVSDSGVGIPADMLGYVFDMFTQVGRSIDRSQGGLGIGLTLVRRLVEMHGGSVTAESDGAGHGATFVVTLPIAAPIAAAAADLATPAAPGLRVLVVDDNLDAAEMLVMLLELRGHEVHMVHTGPDAVEAAAAFAPQVVFLDIGLPGLNGYEVARRIRAGHPRPPLLVAVTGWGTDEDRRQAAAAGFDRHLVKPVDLAKLEAALVDVRRAT